MGHLDGEEAVVVPAVDSVVLAAEANSLSEKEMKHATFSDMKVAVP